MPRIEGLTIYEFAVLAISGMKISLKIFILYVAKRVTADRITFMFFRFEKKNPSKYSVRQSVDLSSYSERIADYDDRLDFNNAVEAAKVGSLKLAHIGIWITVIESLKRRILHRTERKWNGFKVKEDFYASDQQLIIEARKISIISENDKKILDSVLTLRNLYAHANSCEPSKENILSAAADAVDILLHKSKCLNLEKGEETILYNLLKDQSYLKDNKDYLQKFVEKILPKLNKDHHNDFLEYYWIELEEIHRNTIKSKYFRIIFRRGIWFSQTLLLKDMSMISDISWKDKINKYENIISEICGIPGIFEEICEETQNKVIDTLTNDKHRLLNNDNEGVHAGLKELYSSGILLESQKETVDKYFKEQKQSQNPDKLAPNQELFNDLIDNLKEHYYPTQKKAIIRILHLDLSEIDKFTESQKIELGRNILQTAEGGCWAASDLIEEIAKNANEWPIDLIHGIAIECFTNESSYIRFKIRELDNVLMILDKLKNTNQNEIVKNITTTIKNGQRKNLVEYDQLANTIRKLEKYSWINKLSGELRNKAIDLLEPSNQNYGS